VIRVSEGKRVCKPNIIRKAFRYKSATDILLDAIQVVQDGNESEQGHWHLLLIRYKVTGDEVEGLRIRISK
jgi:hypothetical protein